MSQARHEARAAGEEYCTHAIGANSERKTSLGEYKLLWENNIKIDVERKGCEGVH